MHSVTLTIFSRWQVDWGGPNTVTHLLDAWCRLCTGAQPLCGPVRFGSFHLWYLCWAVVILTTRFWGPREAVSAAKFFWEKHTTNQLKIIMAEPTDLRVINPDTPNMVDDQRFDKWDNLTCNPPDEFQFLARGSLHWPWQLKAYQFLIVSGFQLLETALYRCQNARFSTWEAANVPLNEDGKPPVVSVVVAMAG